MLFGNGKSLLQRVLIQSHLDPSEARTPSPFSVYHLTPLTSSSTSLHQRITFAESIVVFPRRNTLVNSRNPLYQIARRFARTLRDVEASWPLKWVWTTTSALRAHTKSTKARRTMGPSTLATLTTLLGASSELLGKLSPSAYCPIRILVFWVAFHCLLARSGASSDSTSSTTGSPTSTSTTTSAAPTSRASAAECGRGTSSNGFYDVHCGQKYDPDVNEQSNVVASADFDDCFGKCMGPILHFRMLRKLLIIYVGDRDHACIFL